MVFFCAHVFFGRSTHWTHLQKHNGIKSPGGGSLPVAPDLYNDWPPSWITATPDLLSLKKIWPKLFFKSIDYKEHLCQVSCWYHNLKYFPTTQAS